MYFLLKEVPWLSNQQVSASSMNKISTVVYRERLTTPRAVRKPSNGWLPCS